MFPELDLFGLDVRLANDAAIFVILFAKISAELCTSLPERPWMTRFAFTSGTCVAGVNQPVSWETVSFDVLIAQRRYAGVTRPPCQSQQCGVPDFLALMN
jgi:hypothetical protein